MRHLILRAFIAAVYILAFVAFLAMTAALIITAPPDQFGTTTTSSTEPTIG